MPGKAPEKSSRIRLGAITLRDTPVNVPREHKGGAIFLDPFPIPHVIVDDCRYPMTAVLWFQFPHDL